MLAGLVPGKSLFPSAHDEDSKNRIEQFDIYEFNLKGPSIDNPFIDVSLAAVFTLGYRSVEVEGFYDGDGNYKVRFMPDTVGEWLYCTKSNAKELNGKKGSFTCVPAKENNHGPVSVARTLALFLRGWKTIFPFRNYLLCMDFIKVMRWLSKH